jgi:hypothetical protein
MSQDDEGVTSRPLGMDSRVAVQTAALRARGAVYVKAGAAMTELVGGGSAFRIAHQLVDIVETGRETSLEVGDLVALANNKVPSLRPIFNLFVSKDAVAFYTSSLPSSQCSCSSVYVRTSRASRSRTSTSTS